jgi:hypothetical protein
MTSSSSPPQGLSLSLIEGGLTLIGAGIAVYWPQIASTLFGRIERVLSHIARRKRLAIAIPGLTLLLLRLAMLPLLPIPLPFVPDDFSFLLAADTFASGRLTNPSPAMWIHFETIHVTMNPTYMSMYFPAQGLLLAFGKVFLGHPWFGVLLSGAMMCSVICWMLQAWLPSSWAFLGAMLAVLRLGLFSYWMNTYTGGGLIAATGGALVLGALPRYMRSVRQRDAMLLALGVVLLLTSRPYEGMLLCVPVGVVLIRWAFSRSGRPSHSCLVRSAAFPLALVLAAGSWVAYYDYRAFGNPLTLPYTVDRATYAVAPYYVWQPPRLEPQYRHAVLREFYAHQEVKPYRDIHSVSGFVPHTIGKALRAVLFFAGFALLLPLIMVRRVFFDRRMRFFILCICVLMAGMLIEIYLLPHYLAPFTAVFYAIGLQCLRHLRVWRPKGRPLGIALVRVCVVLCVGMAAIRLYAKPLNIGIAEWPASSWSQMWYGPDHYGSERAAIQDRLTSLPGKQLVIVRYSPSHHPLDEWVYNSPDIDSSKVIWAREMDEASNDELIHYYRDRNAWLVQPDLEHNKLSTYPGQENGIATREVTKTQMEAELNRRLR